MRGLMRRIKHIRGDPAVAQEAGFTIVEVAVTMILVILFFVAALIEGLFRQLVHNIPVRWLLAGTTLMLWVLYFGYIGKQETADA